MATERLSSLEQVRAFVEGSEGLDFVGSDRGSRNDFVRRILVKFDYGTLVRADKGLAKRFLPKATGLSRAQLTRLIRQHAETGRIEDRRGSAPAKPFARRYAAVDAVLLAEVDETLAQVCGQATRAVMRREFEVFGDGRKGVYEINLVDEAAQYEFVGATEAISERFLIPVLEGLLAASAAFHRYIVRRLTPISLKAACSAQPAARSSSYRRIADRRSRASAGRSASSTLKLRYDRVRIDSIFMVRVSIQWVCAH